MHTCQMKKKEIFVAWPKIVYRINTGSKTKQKVNLKTYFIKI